MLINTVILFLININKLLVYSYIDVNFVNFVTY